MSVCYDRDVKDTANTSRKRVVSKKSDDPILPQIVNIITEPVGNVAESFVESVNSSPGRQPSKRAR